MILDNRSSRICLSLTEATIEDDLRLVEKNRKWIDLLELRADFLDPTELPNLARFPALAGVPTLLAFRRRSDGGVRSIPERERISILTAALAGRWTYLDLEEDLDAPSLATEARSNGSAVIRSFHDLDGVPEDLARRIDMLPRRADEIPKAAVMPRSTADLVRLVEYGRAVSTRTRILVGMGEWGFPSRILARKLASAICYSTAGERLAAPGHIGPERLETIYRFRRIGESTRVVAVIGNPVLHSRSPWIHNPAYQALGIDAVYVPVQVDEVAQFFRLADILGIDGASVTVPHKQAVIPHLARRDESVAAAGSCNTLVRTQGAWSGYNTDIEGFLAPLRRAVGSKLSGRNALVVGAGGAARAVVAGLVAEGCRVTITNRTVDRARELAERFGCTWRGPDELFANRSAGFEVVVQTTSAGMTPNESIDPLPGYRFTGNEVVYELIYAPPQTRFLTRAAQAGCTTLGGSQMLLEQAYAQFKLFTGQDYPRDLVLPEF